MPAARSPDVTCGNTRPSVSAEVMMPRRINSSAVSVRQRSTFRLTEFGMSAVFDGS